MRVAGRHEIKHGLAKQLPQFTVIRFAAGRANVCPIELCFGIVLQSMIRPLNAVHYATNQIPLVAHAYPHDTACRVSHMLLPTLRASTSQEGARGGGAARGRGSKHRVVRACARDGYIILS